MNHREYVGDKWEEIGKLQFDFLLSKGLKPHHSLLDIACGSLRLGVQVIPYLNRCCYLGLEKESSLVEAGLTKELESTIREKKQPNIVISDSFEFEKLDVVADFAIAQSLFTHLPPRLIELCFRKLYPALKEDGVFYATYHQVKEPIQNLSEPDPFAYFAYTKSEIKSFGTDSGFLSKHIGDWKHPRDQIIVEYRKSPC